MDAKNFRQTRQKTLILEAIKQESSPQSAEQILAFARKSLPSMALTTVYRNLEQLAGLKAISKMIYPDGITRYQMTSTLHHHQLVCLGCAKAVDISQCPLECLASQIETDTGYSIVSHQLALYGYCSDCQQKKPRIN